MADSNGVFGSLRGVVETLEQKSGLNPLLFLDAIFGIPAIFSYAWKGNAVLLWFAAIPLLITELFYAIAFFVDRNFLRSEKHVYDMKQLDILGEKGKEINEQDILDIPSTTDPNPDRPMIEGKNK